MDAKVLAALLLTINCYSSCGAALRRTPKVYNALITTDENLTPSRSYPVIQPSIHETGLANYPFGPYNPFALYGSSFVRFGQPIVPGLPPGDEFPFHFAPSGPSSQAYQQPRPLKSNQPQSPQIPPTGPLEVATAFSPYNSPLAPSANSPLSNPPLPQRLEPQSQNENEIVPPPTGLENEAIPNSFQDSKIPDSQSSGRLPIPLNEFGLPPSLIPLQTLSKGQRPPLSALPPYPYHNFPLIYEPYNSFQNQYLPPYDYFPSHPFGLATPSPLTAINPPVRTTQPTPEKQQSSTTPPPETTPAFQDVKNESASKNKEVPDVPPPPIPSGAKPSAK